MDKQDSQKKNGFHQDLYSLEPQMGPVPENLQQQLIKEAKQFHQYELSYQSQDFFLQKQKYLLSKRWFDRWKVYVSYEEVIKNKPTSKFLGVGQMPEINEDIINSKKKFLIKFQDQHDYLNICLKDGLAQDRQYVFINKNMWQSLVRYPGIQVRRYVKETVDGKKVQLYFQQINMVILFNSYYRVIEGQRVNKFIEASCQVSRYDQIKQVQSLIGGHLKNIIGRKYQPQFSTHIPLRFWILPPTTQKSILMNTFLQMCKANPSYSYKLYTDGQFMQQDKKIQQFDIFDDTLIIAQVKQLRQNWNLFNAKKPFEGSCNYCKQKRVLEHLCACKAVTYCSRSCKNKDKSSHRHRCPVDAQSDQEQQQLCMNADSKKGIVGLRNLGNTCFMNSGLQCCSQIHALTQYFLADEYIKDINKQNPLGTGGQLSIAYGKLIKQMWFGSESIVVPTVFKRAIGKFQPMFSGYNQHDSGQLISYLLDGLHQDLNKIKKKPYIQTKDYDGRADEIIAKQTWEIFMKRNSSKIVDLMYGQYRSVLTCPKCQTCSIQFDPFLMCSLPIINNNIKKIEIKYYENNVKYRPVTLSFDKSLKQTVKDALQLLIEKLQLPKNTRLVAYVASHVSCQIIRPKTSISEVERQYKYRSIYVRRLQENQDPQDDITVQLGITTVHPYYRDQSYRKHVTSYRMYFVNKNTTCKQIHHRLYNYYKDIKQVKDYEKDIIENKQSPLKVLAISPSKHFSCRYCKKKSCDGCPFPYDDTKIGQFIGDHQKIEIQFYWKDKSIKVEDIFENIQTDREQQSKNRSETTLSDCFKLFQEPEILGQDNAWYCPKCKDFVLAKKQMEIYKAPKILILCLKRFKRKGYFQQKYNILIDFPIDNFDMSQYVVNKDLPQEYFTETTSQHKKILYDLFAVSHHSGGTGGGHYTASCKNPINKRWYDFNDSSVHETGSPSNVIRESAYILFYQRKDD